MKSMLKSHYRILRDFVYQISIGKLVSLLLILLITTATFAIAGISYNLSEQIIRRKSDRYCKDILKEISSNINIKLQEVDSLTTFICYNETIQSQINKINRLENSFVLYEKKILEKELINMTVANKSLKEITILTSSGQSAWISQPNTEFTIDSPILDTLHQNQGSLCWITLVKEDGPEVIAGRTINDLGLQTAIGDFLVHFDEQILHSILQQKEFFEDGTLCIIDQDGIILSSNIPEYIGQSHLYQDLLADATETTSNIKLDNSQEWLTFCNIANADWKLVSLIPNIAYEREIIWLRRCIFLISFCTILVATILVVSLTNRLFYPLRQLGNMMKTVGDGNFNVSKPTYYRNDIGELYDYFIDMVCKVQKLITTTNQQQVLLQKAELNSLRMQINPHFIYNTLESIKWMAYISDNEEIVTMVKALGDFMRNNISGPEFITVEKELENANCYLTIQKLRYEKKLEVQIEIDLQLYQAQIPKLILQPLIENSIVHGLEPKSEPGKIHIKGYQHDHDLIIEIIDNGIGFSKETQRSLDLNAPPPTISGKSGNLGMRNVHQRIQMYYGKEYGLTIRSEFGIETTVCIKLPLINL